MPINVFIDTQQISDVFGLDASQIDELMDYTVKEITARFAGEWQNEANRTLKTSRQQYINNIIVVDEGPARGAVVLTGWLPNAIEQGLSSFDMKTGILNGPNAKIGKDGSRYNTIPFSFGTPGALEENFSNIMPQEIYEIVKNKPIRPETGTSQPLKASELPSAFKEPEVKKIQIPQSQSFREYQHKSSIYAGITKRQDSVTGQNSYGSFRRVSDKSDIDSWQHPGIDAHNLADKTLELFDIPSEVSRILDAYL